MLLLSMIVLLAVGERHVVNVEHASVKATAADGGVLGVNFSGPFPAGNCAEKPYCGCQSEKGGGE